MMQHHPCNRFGYGHHLNPHHHQVVTSAAPVMHQHHPHSYQPQPQQQDYQINPESASAAIKQTNNLWTPVGHQQPSPVSTSRDLPLTPPPDREAANAQSYGSYGYVLSTPGNYGHQHSPVDKAMTPPQEIQHHQAVHHQQPTESSWWIPPTSHQTDFSFHHHQQMLAHYPAVPSSSSPCHNTPGSPPSSSPNPSGFQDPVAAALLNTHASLASRRCRRCRCPNCQVLASKYFLLYI